MLLTFTVQSRVLEIQFNQRKLMFICAHTLLRTKLGMTHPPYLSPERTLQNTCALRLHNITNRNESKTVPWMFKRKQASLWKAHCALPAPKPLLSSPVVVFLHFKLVFQTNFHSVQNTIYFKHFFLQLFSVFPAIPHPYPH